MTASIFDTVRADELLQPIDWVTTDGTLQNWIVDKLDFDVTRVIWADQNLAQPPYPYISMRRGPIVEGGGFDETRTSTDLTQSSGEEIEILTTSPREFTLNLQAHVDEANGANDANCNAVKFLTKLQSSLDQISVHSALEQAGLAVIERLGVNDISLVLNGQFINRASFDIRFRTTSVMTERTGFIEKVEVKSPAFGVDETFDASS